MQRNIDAVLEELYALDPSFKTHEKELRAMVGELLQAKPDTQFDAAFAAQLRARLQAASQPSPYARHFPWRYAAAGALAVFVIAPLAYVAVKPQRPPTFALNQEVQSLPQNAFGTLQTESGGKGSAAETKALAPSAAQTSVASMGMGGGVSDARIMNPGPVTVYSYVYKGEELHLPDTEGLVYNRTRGQNSGQQIASQLQKFNFGLVNLGAFGSLKLRNFELFEDKPLGYAISVNFDEGMISISPNYTQWPNFSGKEVVPQPLPMSAMPDDKTLTALADQFLKDHGISRANYGDPIVQNDTVMYVTDMANQTMPAPDQVMVTYPLKIKGSLVYEDGASVHGLQVGISVRDKKVMSVYNLTSQTFTSSSYKLETNTQKVLSVLERGGVHAWVPEASPEMQIKKVSIEVGTPQKVLMHTMNYTEGVMQELYVPALLFPIIKAPEGEQYYPKSILIPLVQDLLNEPASGPIMYDQIMSR